MSELGFRLEVFQGSAGLEALAAGWRALVHALPRPSYVQLWEWHRAFLTALAPDPEAFYAGALYEGDMVVAIVPLVFAAMQLAGVRVHGAGLPHHEHARHGDILVHPRVMARFDLAGTLAAMRRRLGRPWDVTRLGPTTEDSTATAAVGVLRPDALRVTESDGLSDALENGPYEALMDSLSKNFRGALRKARNKLNRLEGVRVEWASTPEAVAAAFPRFLEVEASGWKGKAGAGTAIALDPALRGFYGELARLLAASGHGRLNLLMHGDRVMAGQFGIVAGERYFLLKIGYDESYKHEAPGNLLLERLLQTVAGEPAIRYVDLVSDAAWHQSWKPVQRRVLVHHVFHPTPRGVPVWLALRGKQLLRPAVHELRRRGREWTARVRPARAAPEAVAPATTAGRAEGEET
jgi:CelD/BcsL family acetyltransferase involved in cellulose biosynthesis